MLSDVLLSIQIESNLLNGIEVLVQLVLDFENATESTLPDLTDLLKGLLVSSLFQIVFEFVFFEGLDLDLNF